MSEATKGPWTLDERHETPHVTGADGFQVAELPQMALCPSWQEANPDKHWGSSEGSHITRSIEELEANARLIAAAPDLLAACQSALELIDDLRGYASHWDWKYGKSWDGDRATIAAALAKATTKEQANA